MDKNLLEVSMMLGDAIDKLNNLSAYKPKEKKKLYLFAYSYVDKGRVMQSTSFYKDIDDFKNDNYKFSLCNIKRIDKSMIEVDA